MEATPLTLKLRIKDAVSIKGINDLSKSSGLSNVNVVRSIIKEHFENKTPTTAANNIDISSMQKDIEELKVLNRILIKKLFSLNEEEFLSLVTKAKKN